MGAVIDPARPRRKPTARVIRLRLYNTLLNRYNAAVTRLVIYFENAVACRQPRVWLAYVGVPLAMNATMLLTLWWAWFPLALCAWWCADRSWRGSWLVASLSGALGTCWCVAGVSALQYWPRSPLVAAVWIGAALVLAGSAQALRRNYADSWGLGSGY
jgi:hypothetical protein